ncbi:MAG: DUF3352 domain-containing protein [Scytonematopsis contorta HA4267-MV1]|jgi:hypothetical protein|nr:DUF3352 domain-containing protein [Scytonematopsis contorta HA4267-MV1]
MVLPVVSASKKKKSKPSLVLTLGTAGVLIGGGVAAYLFLSQGKPFSSYLPPGANIIPQDALFTVSLTTDSGQWEKLRSFGTKEAQAELDKNLVQLRERFLNSNGYDFQKDIQPWVGEQVTIAVLPEAITDVNSSQTPQKPATDTNTLPGMQSMVMVLPVKNPGKAQSILAQPKNSSDGKFSERTYNGVTIKETQQVSGEKFSAALLDGNYLVITDNPKATEKTIDAFKNKQTLATSAGFADNFPKVATYQPLAQFYVNVPSAAKLATASSNRQLPAQVLAQLQNNQGLAGTLSLEPEGMRLRGVSWLNPNSQRQFAVENKAGTMQNLISAETMVMLSGGNLQRFWADYVLTAQANPQSPIEPEQLRKGIKSLTNNEIDLDRDLLSWMGGEFSVSVMPSVAKEGTPENFRAALVFMVKASDRKRAEDSLRKLDDVMKNQFQFQIQGTTVANKPLVNWVGPLGTLTATHGWLDGDVAFFVLGAPISDRIVPKPNTTLGSTLTFQQTVPAEPNPTNGQFFLDLERTGKYFPLQMLLPNQKYLVEATRSLGVTTSVSDSRSNRFDIFVSLKKGEKPMALPNTINTPSAEATPLPTVVEVTPQVTKTP